MNNEILHLKKGCNKLMRGSVLSIRNGRPWTTQGINSIWAVLARWWLKNGLTIFRGHLTSKSKSDYMLIFLDSPTIRDNPTQISYINMNQKNYPSCLTNVQILYCVLFGAEIIWCALWKEQRWKYTLRLIGFCVGCSDFKGLESHRI